MNLGNYDSMYLHGYLKTNVNSFMNKDECILIYGLGVYWIQHVPTSSQYMHIATDHGAFGLSSWNSDEKLKMNILPTTEIGLDKINNIKHRSFCWNSDNRYESCGYIAQELKEVFPEVIMGVPQEDGGENLQIVTPKLIPYITKAIQELDEKITW